MWKLFGSVTHHVGHEDHKKPCAWCHEPIVEGEKYDAWYGVMGGRFHFNKMHKECSVALKREADYEESFRPGTHRRGMTEGETMEVVKKERAEAAKREKVEKREAAKKKKAEKAKAMKKKKAEKEEAVLVAVEKETP